MAGQTQTMTKGIVNGVDCDQLFGTMDAIKGTPTIAKFKFRAQNQWINGGHNRTTIGDFYGACQAQPRNKPFVLDADEPPVLLGEDQGANPVEYLLTALAACMTTSIVYHAAARGIKLEEVKSTLEGDLDLHGFLGLSKSVRPGYEKIRVTFKVKGDGSAEELTELTKYSPVFDVVSKSVPVSVRVEKVEKKETAVAS